MRQFLFGLSISLAFIAGSITSQVAHPIIPPAYASVPVQRWEYNCKNEITRPWNRDDMAKLDFMGRQGWELVQQLVGVNGTNYDVFCFKRPLSFAPQQPPPPGGVLQESDDEIPKARNK